MYAATSVALCRFPDSLCAYRKLSAYIANCSPHAGHSHILLGVSPPDATETVGTSDRQGLVVLALIQVDTPAKLLPWHDLALDTKMERTALHRHVLISTTLLCYKMQTNYIF
jgi:hypothetical protein